MDPEALETFIAAATPEDLAEQLRVAWQTIRCCVAVVSAVEIPTLVPAVSLASG